MNRSPEATPAPAGALNEDALRGRLQSIARAEMSRRRKRLGRITSEQERAITELLGSMVEKISSFMIDSARESYLSGEVEQARAWLAVVDPG